MSDAARARSPMVTISLVTYNGLRWLPGCLASVCAQEMADFEVSILDNASTDGTVEWLREQVAHDARMSLIESAENLGFAKAQNRLILAARGEFVLLLNQDVELDAAFLRTAVSAFDGRPRVAAIQPRLRRLSAPGSRTGVLDSTGLVMHRDRRVVSRRQGERESARDLVPGPVWGADGPAPVYRRDALLAARVPRRNGGWEILDEDFFMYKEDVDLAWRLRLLGWQAWYAPRALAWHGRGAGGHASSSLLDILRADRIIPRWIKAVSWRNHRLMQVKNDDLVDLHRELPFVARRELLSLAFALTVDPRRIPAMMGIFSVLRRSLRKRRHIRLLMYESRRGGRARRDYASARRGTGAQSLASLSGHTRGNPAGR